MMTPLENNSFTDLLDNPELVRQLLDINPTLVFVKDRQGRFVFANKAFADIYSSSVDMLLGKTDADFNPHVGEIEYFLEYDLRVMDSMEDLFIPEERVTSPQGDSVWLETAKRPLIGRDGTCNHILGVSVDITRRVLAETKGKELQKQLHHYQRLESLGTMAGGIAHDLNNILGPLIGYPSLIREQTRSEKIGTYLDEMERSSNSALALIDDLLTLARRGEYQAKPISLVKCVDDFLRSATANNLKSVHPEVELRLELSNDLPPILGTEAHVRRVLINLTKNAFEAHNGAGTVSIFTRAEESSELDSGLDRATDGRCVVIEVADTGAGITEADRDKIFEPFYSRKLGSTGGTGLGLPMVSGVVKDMNGSIKVESKQGVGSTFTVRLPVAAKPVDDVVDDLAETVSDYRGNERILIVDDLSSQRQLASRLLGALGYQVQTAANGEDALELCTSSNSAFSLVIIDMILGDGPDGVEVYRNLHKHFPKLPCIIVSGYSESEQVRQGLVEGVDAFVRKPYTQAVLGAEVRSILNR